MLHLLLGRDWTANRDEILNRIAEDVSKSLPGRILIVPELISHDTERRLCAAAGDTSSRYAEVLSFTRLVKRVFDSMGSAAQECLDDGGRVVAMAAAARQMRSRLKAYASVETKPEFLTGLIDGIDEFKRCCISSEDLLHAAKMTNGSLAQKLEELDKELAESQKKKANLQAEKNAVINDESLDAEEKAEKIAALNDAISDENDRIDSINRQREAVMSVDDKIRAAHRQKSQLEEEYQKTADAAGMDMNMKEARLDALNEQIKEVDQEIMGYQKQKQRMLLEQEKTALAKEPAVLRSEYVGLKDSQETLNLQREELVRQRDRLTAEQGNYAVGTREHEALGERINGLHQQIGAKDQALSDNLQQQNTIATALAKQQSGLYDRQAYNLHERVKAQSEYDNAKARAEDLQQRLKEADTSRAPYLAEGTPQRRKLEGDLKAAQQDMEKAENRIGELSREDRRIAARLHEISPDFNQVSSTDLKEAKRAQAVKRAEIQKEIASVQEQMEADPDNRQHYRSQIAKLQSEVADCNYKSARID